MVNPSISLRTLRATGARPPRAAPHPPGLGPSVAHTPRLDVAAPPVLSIQSSQSSPPHAVRPRKSFGRADSVPTPRYAARTAALVSKACPSPASTTHRQRLPMTLVPSVAPGRSRSPHTLGWPPAENRHSPSNTLRNTNAPPEKYVSSSGGASMAPFLGTHVREPLHPPRTKRYVSCRFLIARPNRELRSFVLCNLGHCSLKEPKLCSLQARERTVRL
jgi:hypothetical protein